MTDRARTDRERQEWNGSRWTAGEPRGHYESWFCRANHPGRPLAFWIRYTIFSPKGRPKDAIGELWAVAFDGEKRAVIAVKEERPIRECTFHKSELRATIGESTLDHEALRGEAAHAGHRIGWSLRYTSPAPPLFILDRSLYAAPFPKAKAVVGSPFASYAGTLTVDGDEWPIDGWIGSQNHNWGEKHTDRYAWGQVAGFDGADDVFLEAITARVKLGPVMTPPMTALVLRMGDEELAFNTIGETLRTKGDYDFFQWRFEASGDGVELLGTIAAGPADFVGLPYMNPPGGTKTCLNSKIASCAVTVRRAGRPPLSFYTRSRAAFEILTDATDHGVRVLERPSAREERPNRRRS